MKLGKLDNDRNVKLVASIPETVYEELNAYAECYTAVHGQDIAQSRLVGEMLRRFMQEDVSFQKWLKSRPAAVPAEAPAPAVVPAATPAPAVKPAVAPSFNSQFNGEKTDAKPAY